MSKKQCSMTIGVLAKASGMGVETIRYYQRRELVAEPEKPYGGVRHYDEQTLARLHFIRTAKWLGFNLDEIGELLKLEDGAHCDEARALAEHKLDDLRRKIAALRQMESTLGSLVERCRCSEDPQRCPLIHSLQGNQDVPNEEIEK
jgi:MerR family mercuric resistance operon transcriptional regulator